MLEGASDTRIAGATGPPDRRKVNTTASRLRRGIKTLRHDQISREFPEHARFVAQNAHEESQHAAVS